MDVAGLPAVDTNKGRDTALWNAAQSLEASFLAEMLKHSGLGATTGQFSGGIGEEQFSSLLRHAQGEAMVEAGGIGLAESIYKSLQKGADGQ